MRKLIENGNVIDEAQIHAKSFLVPKIGRNYRVQKDFDSIQKMEFIEQSFKEIKQHINRFLQEIDSLENIKYRIIKDADEEIEVILVNRNKIATEARLKIFIAKDDVKGSVFFARGDGRINYFISKDDNNIGDQGYNLQYDDYDLFWVSQDYHFRNTNCAWSGRTW